MMKKTIKIEFSEDTEVTIVSSNADEAQTILHALEPVTDSHIEELWDFTPLLMGAFVEDEKRTLEWMQAVLGMMGIEHRP